ncbi:MAG: helix-turn-helix transcriptional regulator [Pseudomonadota bacterium]
MTARPRSSVHADDAGEPAGDLLFRLGDRVRRAREGRGLPRRVVCDASGLSPRYLAALESGTGNISVARLHALAGALGVTLDELLADENSDAAQVARLFNRADSETRAQVMGLLGAEARAARVCLIGLRGAGKSTLGRAVAARLGAPFVELRLEVERVSGMPVGELIALSGPEALRRAEAEALRTVIGRHDRMILAVGGGFVTESETFETTLARCHTIWLRARAREHMDRVRGQGDSRPMAGNPRAMEELRTLLAAREPLYARAGATLDTANLSVTEATRALADLITTRGYLLKAS